jgi:hypothetical protein
VVAAPAMAPTPPPTAAPMPAPCPPPAIAPIGSSASANQAAANRPLGGIVRVREGGRRQQQPGAEYAGNSRFLSHSLNSAAIKRTDDRGMQFRCLMPRLHRQSPFGDLIASCRQRSCRANRPSPRPEHHQASAALGRHHPDDKSLWFSIRAVPMKRNRACSLDPLRWRWASGWWSRLPRGAGDFHDHAVSQPSKVPPGKTGRIG